MAIRNIVYSDNPLLNKKSKKVVHYDEKLWELLDDMNETMVKNNGQGLAAPQIGVLKRICLVNPNNMFLELINPEILEQFGTQCEVEGCLSVKNVQAYVNRPEQITVKADDRYGNEFIITGTGDLARVLSHEIDHLEGVLFTSKIERPYVPSEEDRKIIVE